jgi:hypothetical protein
MPRPYEKIFIFGGEASVFHEGLACAWARHAVPLQKNYLFDGNRVLAPMLFT